MIFLLALLSVEAAYMEGQEKIPRIINRIVEHSGYDGYNVSDKDTPAINSMLINEYYKQKEYLVSSFLLFLIYLSVEYRNHLIRLWTLRSKRYTIPLSNTLSLLDSLLH